MAAGDELLDFVRDALGRGVPRVQIEDALRKGGWTTDQIRGALNAFAEIDFPIPVPRARPYLSAREAFIYLVLFGTLYASAFNLGSLAFDFINRAFPDASQTGEGFDEYFTTVDPLVDLVADRRLPGVPVSVMADRAGHQPRSDQAGVESPTLAHLPDDVVGRLRAAWRFHDARLQRARG